MVNEVWLATMLATRLETVSEDKSDNVDDSKGEAEMGRGKKSHTHKHN